MGTENGLYILNLNENKSIHIKKQYADPYSIDDNVITDFCKDKEGNTWIGTFFGGVNYYSRQRENEMKVKVLIFGQLKDVTHSATCEVSDVHDTDQMIRKMNDTYPGLREKKFLIAVEKEIIQKNTTLKDNFTVALLPPYSGG